MLGNVYITEGFALYEWEVTSKVIESTLEEWPEVDPPSV